MCVLASIFVVDDEGWMWVHGRRHYLMLFFFSEMGSWISRYVYVVQYNPKKTFKFSTWISVGESFEMRKQYRHTSTLRAT